MAVPLAYSLRNLLTRRLTTALTAGGMALVVFVFASVLMLAAGLETTLVQTGSPGNALVLRAAAETEIQSGLDREQADVIAAQPEIATGRRGEALAVKEVVVLVNLPKRGTGQPANVTVRGVDAASLELRPQVRLVAGRYIRPGAAEVVVGGGIAKRFEHTGLGERLRFGLRDWRVVGVFDAGNTGFGSEVWGDADLIMQAFRRPVYSSVIFKLADPGAFERLKERLTHDPRLTVDVWREVEFYAKQSEMLASFIRILGTVLTVIFSFGATIGAMITMYAAVANRTREIGTLRALGFSRRSVLAAFLAESLLLAAVGAAVGLATASLMQFLTISTTNFQTFSELAFSFTLTPGIALWSGAFALGMGLAGGVLPALRAARLNIVEALRAA
jgi:ABC-type antimicrobial peptide transport system permease subunit